MSIKAKTESEFQILKILSLSGADRDVLAISVEKIIQDLKKVNYVLSKVSVYSNLNSLLERGAVGQTYIKFKGKKGYFAYFLIEE